MINPQIFLFVALILIATKAFRLITQRAHLPKVVGALVAGIVLGPTALNIVEPNEAIHLLAEIGVVLLLFTAGLETDFKQLRDGLKSSLLIGVLGIIAALGGGFAISLLLGKPMFESFFIGVVIASSSTSITVETLHEIGKFKTKSGTSIMGAALFEDILVITTLAIVLGVGSNSFTVSSIGIILLKIIAFFICAIVSGLFLRRLLEYLYERFGEKTRLPVFALAYCFIMAYLAEQYGLSDILGAYIAGVVLCNTRCVEYLDTQINTLSYLFFTPIFIASIGLRTSFLNFTNEAILFVTLLATVAIFSKSIGNTIAAKISGFTNRESMQVSVGLMTRGEVSIVIASVGIYEGIFDPLFLSSITVVIIATTLIAPVLLKLVYKNNSLTSDSL